MIYTVIGRRWFDKPNGNTYHSVHVYEDGESIGNEDFDYGYERAYEQCALDIIKKHNPSIESDVLWQLRNEGHKVISEVTDVQRKKDL